MRIFILGICGTFMGGIAAIAREAGHEVLGCDENVYPPMSTQLEALGISLMQGYLPEHLDCAPDVVIVGNVVSRGNPLMEAVLNQQLPYTSGPQWLSEQVLQHKQVLAIAGTHGKTTTTSMLAWVLEANDMQPGFLIGGVPKDFPVSARLGLGDCFVIEADEYDTAFFDKRSKFVHYRPHVAVLNNLEFDHADIFPDLAAIERQMHHLVRTVPGNGQVLFNADDENLPRVLARGCWTPQQGFGLAGEGDSNSATTNSLINGDNAWQAQALKADGSQFSVLHHGEEQGEVNWSFIGEHNLRNGLAAISAAVAVGVPVVSACAALSRFQGVKRRLELRGEVNGVRIYDDFAHHPTAIATTLAGMRASYGDAANIIAVFEPRSNSMKAGAHTAGLAEALAAATQVQLLNNSELQWQPERELSALGSKLNLHGSVEALAESVGANMQAGDHIVVMSNGGFGGLHQLLLDQANALA